MKTSVYDINGNEIREIELSDSIFNLEIKQGPIYYAIKNELANRRVGSASTKTRGEVSGTHQKMYRQKGTGRARMGTKRSPVRVGGGIAFGPRPRNYNYSMPKKMKRLAIKLILSLKQQENRIKIIEDFNIESGKTKDLVSVLKNHVPENKTVIILKDDVKLVRRAGKNISWLGMLSYNQLNAHDLFYGKNIVIQESAVKGLEQMYNDKSVGVKS